ncbi:exonuclease domain-containing protein [Myroides odoratus]|uniref:GIY-YIG nuclease family protein n=1 Tax=Myroides odoratus TaxID=256 RepID=A0A9Q7EBZ7_MYROD|nr:exonuclease domain-containing protein [Myroides odoratus]EHQ43786.1 DNA polymerase III, epsilon subunit [Myroides odoratus DSM 2801]EKB04219.1 exonuclease, DNA polymerase III, epsilon subunit [Myroides odoratus CIP 103059]QQU01100.1 GIY-YIG nuclease family protein [Myroides odoratus]WQD56646.1 exonuclease domain-containing protein [Myroides odoratus]STZ31063.1 Probable ATP-dependent helicase dinG homolog [Myroides odoratus]
MYAILDIETTGGQFNEEGITEIAIYKFDGHQIVDQLISLVNPQKEIQPFVVKLTGINSAMLRLAPKFHELAKRIIEMTEDCVLVAHNAAFDYRVLRNEFSRLGYDFQKDTLCTVELAQKLLPEMPSYSLGKLVRTLGIPLADRHRAYGDALATLKLFQLLLSKDTEKTILTSMIKSDIKTGLNPKFFDITDNLPTSVGIYYIHNEEGEIIFIGKSRNIKKKIMQHFTNNSVLFKKVQKETYTVTFEKTGNELIAILKEAEEILLNKPKYNKVTKKGIFPYSLYVKTNLQGYFYFSLEKTDGRKRNHMAFTSLAEGRKFVDKITADFEQPFYLEVLHEKKSKKVTEETFCTTFDLAFQEYNTLLINLLQHYNLDDGNVLILDKGRTINERSAVVMESGKLAGYCFYDLNYQINDPARIAANLTPITFHRNNRNIILNYLNKKTGYKLIHY